MTRKLGLTGGIACGKSTVAELLGRAGIPIIDTDELARELVRPGQPCLDQIVEQFGHDMLDAGGELDRAKLRERVFADEQARRQLEAILHPPIRRNARQRAESAKAPCVCIVVPLLAEQAEHWSWLDEIVVVDCTLEIQRTRLLSRPGMDETLAERILAAQASRADRLQLADHVIDNSGSLEALARQTQALHTRLCAPAA
ncbi:MAG: dephospho-CoA kinase [Halothiobacillaceae bacterium]